MPPSSLSIPQTPSLFAKVRQEIKKADALKRFGIVPDDAEKVMSLVTTKKPVIIDIREPEDSEEEITMFINNIETDPAFAHWPDNVYGVRVPRGPLCSYVV